MILIAFVVPLQFLTSIFGFLARDVVAGTGMGDPLRHLALDRARDAHRPPGSTSDALGLLLLLAGRDARPRPRPPPASSWPPPFSRRPRSGSPQPALPADRQRRWKTTAGIVGLALCALALYAALAMALEDARRRRCCRSADRRRPRRGGGILGAQLAGIEHEAGVREQL